MAAIVRMEAGDLIKGLENVTDNLTKQFGIVVGKVGRRAESITAKDVTKELAVKQKTVKKEIRRKKKSKTSVEVELSKSARIPLRDFGARQTRKGVSYRISKTSGRKVVHGAFQGPKPGIKHGKWNGRVFKRVGKSRLPIVQLRGPSPWGVVVHKNRLPSITAQVNDELKKQIAERIRYLKLKKSGAI